MTPDLEHTLLLLNSKDATTVFHNRRSPLPDPAQQEAATREAEPRRQYCKFGRPFPRPGPPPSLPTSSQAHLTVPPPRRHPPPPPPSLGPQFTSSFSPDLHLASGLLASLFLLRLRSRSSDLGSHAQERSTISAERQHFLPALRADARQRPARQSGRSAIRSSNTLQRSVPDTAACCLHVIDLRQSVYEHEQTLY